MNVKKRKVCVVTGTRADLGLLLYPMRAIAANPQLELQIVATGMHLSPEFSLTYREIEAAGLRIDDTVEMLLSSDTAVGVSKGVGLGLIGFADALRRLSPDLVVVLGDRFEMFAAAQAALFQKIPMAHLFGGDITEGAFDEAIRHAITKMAHWHFVSNQESAAVVRQLGEDPKAIFVVGSPGLDAIAAEKLLSRQELEDVLAFPLRKRNFLITFHPETLSGGDPGEQLGVLLTALKACDPQTGLLFTMPNADTGGRHLKAMVEQFCAEQGGRAKAFVSLGQKRYLSLLAQVDLVIGNSSSGVYEAPSFKIPTLNIGDRQKGRLFAPSVLQCPVDAATISACLERALQLDCSQVENPYGDGKASQRIAETLASVDLHGAVVKKTFYRI